MAETQRKFNQEFRDGAVRIVEETGSRSYRLPGTWGPNEAPPDSWVARSRRQRRGGEAR
jgi:transposase